MHIANEYRRMCICINICVKSRWTSIIKHIRMIYFANSHRAYQILLKNDVYWSNLSACYYCIFLCRFNIISQMYRNNALPMSGLTCYLIFITNDRKLKICRSCSVLHHCVYYMHYRSNYIHETSRNAHCSQLKVKQ